MYSCGSFYLILVPTHLLLRLNVATISGSCDKHWPRNPFQRQHMLTLPLACVVCLPFAFQACLSCPCPYLSSCHLGEMMAIFERQASWIKEYKEYAQGGGSTIITLSQLRWESVLTEIIPVREETTSEWPHASSYLGSCSLYYCMTSNYTILFKLLHLDAFWFIEF